jgi:hypothetical protein
MIIGVIVAGTYYYTKIPADLDWIKMVVYGLLGTSISTTFPLYMNRRRRAKQRPFMTSKNTFDVAYGTNPYTDGKYLQVYISKLIPNIWTSPVNHYILP